VLSQSEVVGQALGRDPGGGRVQGPVRGRGQASHCEQIRLLVVLP
jgi:hypothetical protein